MGSVCPWTFRGSNKKKMDEMGDNVFKLAHWSAERAYDIDAICKSFPQYEEMLKAPTDTYEQVRAYERLFAAYRAFPGDLDSFSDAMKSGANTPLEYGVLIGRPSAQKEKTALLSNLEQPGWFARTGWKSKPKDTKFHKSTGAVFGVRKDGSWSFYQQKIVDLQEGSFVLSCGEFWPRGFRRDTF